VATLLDDAQVCRQVLDELPVAVSVSSAVRDDDGTIVDFRTEYVNPASVAVSGIPAEEQVGRLATELLPSIREMDLFADTVRVVETGEPYVREDLVFDETIGSRRVAGTFEVEARRFGDGVLSISRDVSRRKEAEEGLAHARRQLERRRFIDGQIASINDRIIASLVEVSTALDNGDVRNAQRALQTTLAEASRIITDLRALPEAR
jgi:hypothetical protein